MEKLTSILVVASRSSADRGLLAKAVSLARCVAAHIYLFSCDADLARLLRHSYSTEEAEKAWNICLAEQTAYLRRLQAEAAAPDVQMSIEATCHSPLYDSILIKVREIQPDLVMKVPSRGHPLRRFSLGSNDWNLTQLCPTSLMLVRPRPWRPAPRFAALVDVADESTVGFAQTIVHTSEYFALGCRGELDLIYSEASAQPIVRKECAASLERLGREYHICGDHVRVLDGDPDEVVPDFTARQDYDAIVLGALTNRKGVAKLRGLLTAKVVDAVTCDVILVKRAGHESIELRELDSDLNADAARVSAFDSGPALPPQPLLAAVTLPAPFTSAGTGLR